MTSAFSGMPGLFMISSAPGPFHRVRSFFEKECHAPDSSYGKCLFTGVLSFTNMSCPCFAVKQKLPTPLSPALNMTGFFSPRVSAVTKLVFNSIDFYRQLPVVNKKWFFNGIDFYRTTMSIRYTDIKRRHIRLIRYTAGRMLVS